MMDMGPIGNSVDVETTTTEGGDTIQGQLAEVRDIVMNHFPHLWSAVEVGLSTCATLLLADNANPVALIYVGPPSAGKTTVVSLFDGASVNGKQ